MARKPLGGKPNLTAAKITDLTGYRPLTNAEMDRLGIPRSSRRWTTQKPGVKRLDASKTVGRTKPRSDALTALFNPYGGKRVSLAAAAKMRADANDGHSPQRRHSEMAKDYAEMTGRKIGDVRKDAEFKRLYKDATAQANMDKAFRNKDKTKRRLEALRILHPEHYDKYTKLLGAYV